MAHLLLDAGYGHGDGYTISLRSNRGAPSEELRGILTGSSCYPPAIPKIYDCLTHSGRYDCTVQSMWFAHFAVQLCANLKAIGITLGIIAVPMDRGAHRFRIPDYMDWTQE